MANEKVRKGYHCAWQIHYYHIVEEGDVGSETTYFLKA
jgi:hypothetical protein